MKLTASLIPVKGITSRVPRSTFPEDAIEQAAHSILEAEGIINPIVVRQISLKEFEVVSGDFEYYAAARAREIDLARGEMIDAIVLTVTTTPETEAALLQQVELLRKQASSNTTQPTSNLVQDTTNVESRITNLEKFLEKQLAEWSQKHLEEKRRLEKIITENKKEYEAFVREVQTYLPKPLEPIEFFNQSTPEELKIEFQRIKIPKKTIPTIITSTIEERQKESFSSLKDIIQRVKQFSDKRMIALLER
jgi:ParB family chromosome partitioning protein